MIDKPHSVACERNRDPILAVLRRTLPASGVVLEIGAGTGQHAVWFARHMPELDWHASDRLENHPGIEAWLTEAGLANLHGPLELDVDHQPWPSLPVDAVFSANTAHIMGWDSVCNLFHGVGRLLPEAGLFCLYGPFAYAGKHTSASNAQFDAWLKQRDPRMGIRDLRLLERQAEKSHLILEHDHPLPANNRLTVWRRGA